MVDQLPLPSGKGSTSTKVVLVDPTSVRISALNPREQTPHAPGSIARLADELKGVGQINDAHGEYAADGVLEILAGSRRTAACIVASLDLKVRVHPNLSREQAVGIAYRDDREAVTPSFWDLSGGWMKLLEQRVVKTDTALAQLVGVDKSTMSRGLAMQKAPEPILAAFADRREITLDQWTELAPLVENEDIRQRLVARAGLIAGKSYGAVRVTSELKAAAAGTVALQATEVRNRHDKVIATIQPDHRGGFTVKVRNLTEAHPSYRLEYLKLIHEKLVEVVKTFFDANA